MKEFTGVLVSRKYQPGQNYLQLLFKSADDLQLCLSSDVQMVRELQPGQTYYVRGDEYTVGRKVCICDPEIALLEQPSTSLRRVWIAAGAICLVLVVGMASVLALQTKSPTAATQSPDHNTTSKIPQTLSEQTDAQPEAASTPAPTPEQTPPTTPTTPAAPTTNTGGSTTTQSTRSAPKPTARRSTSPTPTPQTPAPPEPPEPPAEEPSPEPTPDPPADPPDDSPTDPATP